MSRYRQVKSTPRLKKTIRKRHPDDVRLAEQYKKTREAGREAVEADPDVAYPIKEILDHRYYGKDLYYMIDWEGDYDPTYEHHTSVAQDAVDSYTNEKLGGYAPIFHWFLERARLSKRIRSLLCRNTVREPNQEKRIKIVQNFHKEVFRSQIPPDMPLKEYTYYINTAVPGDSDPNELTKMVEYME